MDLSLTPFLRNWMVSWFHMCSPARMPLINFTGVEEHTYIDVTFYSSVIEDASHPSCRILWDYKYAEPVMSMCKPAFLPGCFNAESREGYHMTYYWFNILDWQLN